MIKKCSVCGEPIPHHDFAMKTATGLACSDCLVSSRQPILTYDGTRKKQKRITAPSRPISAGA